MPQPIHTVSDLPDPSHDISLLSDSSNSDHISSQISSPTPSLIANNPPQGPVTNIERILSQEHWSHSFNIVNSSPSFQSSLSLSFTRTPPIITQSSKTPTPDPDQHFHHCIGKQADTTRTYPTLPLKLDPKFIINLIELVNAKLNQQIFKSSRLKSKYSRKFERYRSELTPIKLNLATKKFSVTKSHSKEATGYNSDPLSSQISSPTPSQIASNPFTPTQGPISNIERVLP